MFQAKLIRKASLVAAAAAGLSLLAGTASAQMFEQPRQFKARDGAGLAVFMRRPTRDVGQFDRRRRLYGPGVRRQRRPIDRDRELVLHHPE